MRRLKRFWQIVRMAWSQPDWVLETVIQLQEAKTDRERMDEEATLYIRFMQVHGQAQWNAKWATENIPHKWDELIGETDGIDI